MDLSRALNFAATIAYAVAFVFIVVMLANLGASYKTLVISRYLTVKALAVTDKNSEVSATKCILQNMK